MSEISISSRLKDLIRLLGLSDSQFADTCEISRATLSLLLSGKNKKISDVLLSQIHKAFPEVSILWLLFGEGEYLSTENTSENDNKSSDVLIFPDEGSESDVNSNLVALNRMEPLIQSVVAKSIDSYFDDKCIGLKSTSEKSKPRKVKQITVYYDDSTFETFTQGPIANV